MLGNPHDSLLHMQVDICCFDKTGTLTSDNMVLEGLAGVPGQGSELVTDVKTAQQEVIRVLAACQALIQVEGKFVGDPLEKASFTATGERRSAVCWSLHWPHAPCKASKRLQTTLRCKVCHKTSA